MDDWNRIILDFVRRLPDGPLCWAALKQSREEDRSKLLLYTELRYGLPMMPIDFWYDKPHVTKTQTYLEFIFGQTHFNYESGTSVGDAIVDSLVFEASVADASSGGCEQLCGRQVRHVPSIIRIIMNACRCQRWARREERLQTSRASGRFHHWCCKFANISTLMAVSGLVAVRHFHSVRRSSSLPRPNHCLWSQKVHLTPPRADTMRRLL